MEFLSAAELRATLRVEHFDSFHQDRLPYSQVQRLELLDIQHGQQMRLEAQPDAFTKSLADKARDILRDRERRDNYENEIYDFESRLHLGGEDDQITRVFVGKHEIVDHYNTPCTEYFIRFATLKYSLPKEKFVARSQDIPLVYTYESGGVIYETKYHSRISDEDCRLILEIASELEFLKKSEALLLDDSRTEIFMPELEVRQLPRGSD